MSTSAERMRAKRARDKETQVTQQSKVEKEAKFRDLFEECALHDKEGKRFKSEARSYTRLLRLYLGQPEIGYADDETSESENKKVKKDKRPNPSETRIRIQNAGIDPTQGGRGRRRRRRG